MKKYFTLPVLLSMMLVAAASQGNAQKMVTEEKNKQEILPTPVRKWYFSNALDAGILSSSSFQKPGISRELTVPRFTFFFNFGMNYNYDFGEHFGLFTGLGIKNIGMIEKNGDSTIKRRVYTVGVPLGFKFGNLQKHSFIFVGGGLDVPFNYREKGFIHRGDKQKFNEWFSDRTAHYMPYLFAGVSLKPGYTLKAQYYPSNFFNEDYQADGKYIYKGYSAYIMYVSLGFDIHYKKKKIADEEPDEADTK